MSRGSYFEVAFGTIHAVVSDKDTPRLNGYEQFFGFTEPPFSLSANPRFRFASASHEAALSQVTYAVERREPVVVVTGDIGMGKTLLCRTVVERLPRKTFLSVINDPFLDRDDLLKRMLQDVGVISAANAAAIESSRDDLAHALEKFLASLGQLGAHAVVIVDEAQHVQPDVLEQIRLLANVQGDRGTLLQIVLVGQPDLQQLLARPELQPLRQRVTRFVSLNALTDEEVRQYVSHRLVVARQTPTDSPMPGAHDLARAIAEWDESSRPVTFTDDALEAVSRLSHGVPRLVNLLCDRGLETAYAARSRRVDAAGINTAAVLLQLPHDSHRSAEHGDQPGVLRHRRYVQVAAAAALLGAIIWVSGRRLETVRRPERIDPATPVSLPVVQPDARASAAVAAMPAPVEPAINEAVRHQDAPIESAGDGFEIVVASFRTEARANDVATQIAALGQPVHQRSLGGWQQVVAGPFVARTAADQAQRLLDRQGFTGTRIVRQTR